MGKRIQTKVMVSLKVQKRLSASVLKCGKGRVWLDPNEATEIALAKSRRSIKKYIKDGYIVKKAVATHSRSKAREWAAAKRLGRHTGMGKRHGSKNARMPIKLFWIRRQRALRRLLRKLRKNKKIDKNLYHKFYLGSKGNLFKNKKVLIEAIHKERNEKIRQEKINQEQNARRMKNLEKRKRKLEKKVATSRAE